MGLALAEAMCVIPIAGRRILEVGCGRGGGASYVARYLRPRSVTAVDVAPAAVDFCRQRGYPRIFLWTFQGLAAARHLYEKCGFGLCEEHDVAQWGQRIREQKFELNLGGDART